MMLRLRPVLSAVLLVSSLAAAPVVRADGLSELLEVEFRNVAAIASPAALSNSYTGTVSFRGDANSELFRVAIGGVNEGQVADFDYFDAGFEFIDGDMTSGFIHAIVANSSGIPTAFYTEFDLETGFIFEDFGTFEIQFITANTDFSSDVFSDADVTLWSSGGLTPTGPTFISQLAPEPTFGIDPDVNFVIQLLETKPGPVGDLNDDGAVDSADLAILLAAWGPTP